MSTRLGRRCVAIAASIILLAGIPSTGNASHNTFRSWAPQQLAIYDYAPCYRLFSSLPVGAFRTRISESRTKWNAAGTEFYIWYTSSTCAKDIEVDYDDLPWPFDGAWAYVANDPFGLIDHSTINFNSCKNTSSGACTPWYTGTGSVPTGFIDLLSVATHEFGHTVELSHSTICDPTCSIMYPTINTGQQRRSLNGHDYQSIRATYAYPAS